MKARDLKVGDYLWLSDFRCYQTIVSITQINNTLLITGKYDGCSFRLDEEVQIQKGDK